MNISLVLSVVILTVFTSYGWYLFNEERYKYRKLVTTSTDLVKGNANFSIVENPNNQILYIEVFGFKFSSRAVFYALSKDLYHLKKFGYKIDVSYFYDKTEPLPNDIFETKLLEYNEKLISWEKENQGRPDLKKKPHAPYDFLKMTLASK